jgi:uncharacterized protein YggE
MLDTFFTKERGEKMGKVFLALGALCALYFGMKFVNEVKRYGTIGTEPAAASTIDVTGNGEAFAIPDVAMAGFSVEAKGATTKEAMDVVTKKVDDILGFLKGAGIAEKDIKTVSYSAYPEYSYPTCASGACPAQEPKLIGYHVSHSISVKVRDTSKLGDIMGGIGSRNPTSITGPDFTVDNIDGVTADARKDAINDAEQKAKVLAKDLGVRLVRIVRFTEGGSNYPTPMYAKDAGYGMGGGGGVPTIPQGENKYTSTVTITYEIR